MVHGEGTERRGGEVPILYPPERGVMPPITDDGQLRRLVSVTANGNPCEYRDGACNIGIQVGNRGDECRLMARFERITRMTSCATREVLEPKVPEDSCLLFLEGSVTHICNKSI